MTKQFIDRDLKTALLAGDKEKVTTLRGLKSAILYEEVAKGKRDEGLSKEEVLEVLAKEAKKRQESIDLYEQAGASDRANAERVEKITIEAYLPPKLSEDGLKSLVDATVTDLNATDVRMMGSVINAVKKKAGPAADGARIAQLVKARLLSR